MGGALTCLSGWTTELSIAMRRIPANYDEALELAADGAGQEARMLSVTPTCAYNPCSRPAIGRGSSRHGV